MSKAKHKDSTSTTLKMDFKRDSSSKLINILLLLLLMVAAFAVVIVVLYVTRPKPVYFATDPKHQLIRIAPLDKAYLSNAELQTWTALTVTELFNFNFTNYSQKLANIAGNFTSNAVAQLLEQLNKSDGVITQIKKNKGAVSSAVASVPVINNATVFLGPLGENYYYWSLNLNLLIAYQTVNATITDCAVVNLTVRRVTPEENPRGIAIESIQLTTVPKTITGFCQFNINNS